MWHAEETEEILIIQGFWWGNLSDRNHLDVLVLDVKKILK